MAIFPYDAEAVLRLFRFFGNVISHLLQNNVSLQHGNSTIMMNDISLNELNARMDDTLASHLNIRCTHVSEGRVEATMPVDKRTRQPFGLLHGGATLALAETAAGIGSLALCDEGETCVGMQVSGNHVSSAVEGDTVYAVATVIHKGRTTHVWNVDVFTSAGKLVSSVRVVNSMLQTG
jgi:uncharacterized protein (TIGR00369 family)